MGLQPTPMPGFYGVKDARAAELRVMSLAQARQLSKRAELRFWWAYHVGEWDEDAVEIDRARLAAKLGLPPPTEPALPFEPFTGRPSPAAVLTAAVAAPPPPVILEERVPFAPASTDKELDDDVVVYTPPHLAAAFPPVAPLPEEPAEIPTSWDCRPKRRSPIRSDRPASASPRKRGRPAKPKT